MINIIRKNKYLLGKLVKKDIEQRYKGSVLGMLWTFIVPIVMLIIYTFVFSEIFKAKWNIDTSNKFEFALVLFCGLSCYNMIAEVMNRSTNLIASNVNYVKKVIFPLEILPVTITFSALFNCVISYLILIAANLILSHTISVTLLQILLVFLPLIIICCGLSYFISAISVYLKDMSNAIGIIVTILMYLSPVFFPLTSVPKSFRMFCEINPLTYIIENFRNVVLYNTNLNLKYYLISMVFSLLCLVFGYYVFKKVKEGFADVL